jgi:hypothetical protein
MKITVNSRVLNRGDRMILRGCEILTTRIVEERSQSNYNISAGSFDETKYIYVETTDYSEFWFDQYGQHIKCEYNSMAPKRPPYRDRDFDIVGIL